MVRVTWRGGGTFPRAAAERHARSARTAGTWAPRLRIIRSTGAQPGTSGRIPPSMTRQARRGTANARAERRTRKARKAAAAKRAQLSALIDALRGRAPVEVVDRVGARESRVGEPDRE